MLNQRFNQSYGIFQLKRVGDPGLNMTVPEVQNFNENLNFTVSAMKKFLNDNAIGLAGPQVGIQRRIFVWKMDEDKTPREIINPEIVEISNDTFYSNEGCLSIPDFNATILRWKKVVIEGYDLNEKKVTVTGHGLRASLIQHEIDHLDGTLIVDHPRRVA
jgi:peptide deformylase